MKEVGMERLREKLSKIDIEISDNQLHQFQVYYDMIIEKNKVMNLTAITDIEEFIDKHFVDSVAIGRFIDMKKEYYLIDVGTGAGFPGIPLKIMYPNLKVVLLDSLNKRVKFLEEVIERLELSDIRGVHFRAEDGGRQVDLREQFDICVSRAVANLTTLSEYCLPFVKVNGYFISYKAGNLQEELDNSKHGISILGGKIEKFEHLILPETDIDRNFVFINKTRNTPKAYPRKPGIASKNPLT